MRIKNIITGGIKEGTLIGGVLCIVVIAVKRFQKTKFIGVNVSKYVKTAL